MKKKTFQPLRTAIALLVLVLGIFGFSSALASSSDTTADIVYGQGNVFNTATANKSGISASSLYQPYAIVSDQNNNLYVADTFNSRVLYYPANSNTATRVYGQGGSFNTNTDNKGGVSASSLYRPIGLAVDSGGNLYIADTVNNRVLYYPAGSTTATRVYGQSGDFTTNTPNKGGISANSLYAPRGLALDQGGNLYVSDTANNRVLYYPAGSTTATRVYGQGGDFTTNTPNKSGVDANSLYVPQNIAVDKSGNLYIADSNNNRVLYYVTGSTTATRVYGQAGALNTNAQNKNGISADSLYNPHGLFLDTSNNLYITDSFNHRVLYFPANSTTATEVYGQSDSFTSGTQNKGGLSADSLNTPIAVIQDNAGNLYISDYRNNRVLLYNATLTVTATSLRSVYHTEGPNSITVTFNRDVNNPAGDTDSDDVTNPVNYLLLEKGENALIDTLSCTGGIQTDDVQIVIRDVSYDSATYTSTLTLTENLPRGAYHLFVCGTTSIVDPGGNPLNGGSDHTVDFTVLAEEVADASSLPATGFRHGQITQLAEQPAAKAYTATAMTVEIPKLGINMPIVGVPQSGETWDVSWLGNSIGYLYGSAFPTWSGNTVLTGHVWDEYDRPGVFAELKTLKYGDEINIQAWGATYTYAVQDSDIITTKNMDAVFQHEELDWITLVTCETYNPFSGEYLFRRAVRAVLVSIQ